MTKSKLIINSLLSLVIATVCLFIFIENSDGDLNLKKLFSIIYDGWYYLLLVFALKFISVYLRSLRWKYLFQDNSSNNINHLFSAQFVSYFINNISPIRIGDFAKSYIVAKKTNNKTSYLLGSIIMERFLDTLMLCVFSIALIWYYGSDYLDFDFSSLFIPISILCIIIGGGYLVYHFFIPTKIKDILDEMWRGFTGIHSSRKSIVIFSSILIWTIYWVNPFLISFYLFPTLGLDFMDCLLILVVSSFVQFIPIGFGGLGVFHLGVDVVLSDYLNIPSNPNFVTMLWLYSYIFYTTLGSYYFLKESRFTLKNLYHDWIKNY